MTDDRAEAVAEARRLAEGVRRDKGRMRAARDRVRDQQQQLAALKERWAKLGVRLVEEGEPQNHPHTARREQSDPSKSSSEDPAAV